ncbi:hypothetical protein, conserved [Trypanosoma brucei gambiense DAL972]|uniref:Uncharacterized protein n=1 Tax=Trypanosoma brucei gambiense (strain MHOM/CI/86/DAL972) TaxID=679716 RepID=C9ZMH4_TRYB9|nr:hypothetical protein, conserved [Trypanosoma brucei gambiense DAL972]CBH10848.1 hypothetical protein, conserved [Trypanosoma brucei gambiense DAL972]|eukprot:XP_011773135.1 hypothetical protein, conserved [Trypanosoma brucei gambiense DAL972]
MPIPPNNGREGLRQRFSEAAKSVSELYRDATYSYDAGYRDALLLVQRYALITAREEVTSYNLFGPNNRDNNVDGGRNRDFVGGGGGFSNRTNISDFSTSEVPSVTSSMRWVTQSSQLLDVKQLLWFIHDTLKRHDALNSASRSLNLRRKRSNGSPNNRSNAANTEGSENDNSGGHRGNIRDDIDNYGRGLPVRRLCSPRRHSEDRNELLLLGEVRVAAPSDVDSIFSEDDV